jgi:hypothetical protein
MPDAPPEGPFACSSKRDRGSKSMNFRQILSEAFESDRLHAELMRLRAEGVARETLIFELNAYHDALESEADQDIIADILDCFYGWCSPDLRID